MGDGRTRRQVALLILAVLLLNPPLLVAIDRVSLPSGVPLTPIFLFLAWLAVILLAALNLHRRED